MCDFQDRVKGALYGLAIGDAMGAPVEGWPPEKIAERFGGHDLSTFLPPTHSGDPSTGKGDGRVTDDTLMTEALILAYCDHQDHLDAYGYAEFLLPHIKGIKVWVPEKRREMDLWDRLWYPEQYPWLRISIFNAEPRCAGRGNLVNCGVAMWMMPVGAVNVGDPDAAYQESVAIGLAHNESYAVEAGAVMAAAVATGLSPDGSIEAVVDTALALARDGTCLAIDAAIRAADPSDALSAFIVQTRDAISPYDPRADHVVDDPALTRTGLSNTGRPSRTASIEELPVALAALRYGDGDFFKTLRAAVYYGRDCDSIASMACCLYGAIYGVGVLPATLRAACDTANRRDFGAIADLFTGSVQAILGKDADRFANRQRALLSSASY